MSKLSPSPISTTPANVDPEALKQLGAARATLKAQIARVIIGQDAIVDDLLTAIFARGHCLMVGVPGLAKTLMIQTISRAIDLQFSRIQFTPDLMPADITGTEVIQQDQATGQREFKFVKGPVFANILLADEINRTPPKTQAALLQAMQETQVTSGGQTFDLPKPFFVLATQNPIEQEGTYPLPEAQLDRFMFMLKVGYPTAREELQIAKTTTSDTTVTIEKVLRGPDILALQKMIRQVPVSDHVAMYCVKLGRATRPNEADVPDFIKQFVSWGVGPRASQNLVLAAKARAALHGEYNVTTDHVKQIAALVLRHRIIPNFRAEAEGIDADNIIKRLLDTIKEPTPAEYDALVKA